MPTPSRFGDRRVQALRAENLLRRNDLQLAALGAGCTMILLGTATLFHDSGSKRRASMGVLAGLFVALASAIALALKGEAPVGISDWLACLGCTASILWTGGCAVRDWAATPAADRALNHSS